MRHISETMYGVLVSQGIANAKPVGAGKVRERKGPGAASDGALGGVAATDREGGQSQSPIGRQGGERPMGKPRKGRQPEPAPVVDMQKRPHRLDGGTRHAIHGTLRLIVNPNMTGMAMRQTTQTPRAVAPRGVVSLMVIDGGKL